MINIDKFLKNNYILSVIVVYALMLLLILLNILFKENIYFKYLWYAFVFYFNSMILPDIFLRFVLRVEQENYLYTKLIFCLTLVFYVALSNFGITFLFLGWFFYLLISLSIYISEKENKLYQYLFGKNKDRKNKQS